MKLLLVDDEKMLSKPLSIVLKKNNYLVDCAYDGEQALDYLNVCEYDAIILDVMMPKLDGISTLKEIRSRGIKTPVIMLTAKSQIEDKLNGLDNGADDYLTKPFSSLELLARLRTIIRREHDTKTSVYSFNGLELDPQTFKIRYKDKEETLSSKEYQVMACFMVNPAKVVTQDYILERIYGLEDGDITTIWVYISYLRRKLNKIESPIIIKAIRNTGYILEKKDD